MDLWTREARLFKYGSGTGTNFSTLRGENEKLSGGGKSSGLMSFLKIGDRAAGAIKSGGTTRRAAKMVIVDIDHPDIEDFIDWKVIEEQKVAALVAGSKLAEKHLKAVLKACVNCEGSGGDCFDPHEEPGAAPRNQARRAQVHDPRQLHRAGDLVSRARATRTSTSAPTTPIGIPRPILSVSGQNSNNTVRVTDEFLKAVLEDRRLESHLSRQWQDAAKTMPARELWDKVSYAAWACADPGIQFHTTHQ